MGSVLPADSEQPTQSGDKRVGILHRALARSMYMPRRVKQTVTSRPLYVPTPQSTVRRMQSNMQCVTFSRRLAYTDNKIKTQNARHAVAVATWQDGSAATINMNVPLSARNRLMPFRPTDIFPPLRYNLLTALSPTVYEIQPDLYLQVKN